MAMTDEDPLDGADIRDAVTVRESSEIWVGDGLTSEWIKGTDRFAETDVTDISVRTDEHGEKYIQVTTESEVTKRLPRRWERCNEPRTASERRRERLNTWASKLATLLPIPITLAIGLGITHRFMRSVSGEVVINGDPLSYSVVDLVPVVGIVLICVAIVFAIPRLPRPGPRGGQL